MFFANINLRASTFKTLAIALSIAGVLFIVLAGYIGNFAIRLATIGAIIVFTFNIRTTYHYSGKLKKFTDIMSLVAAVIVFIFPQLVIFIIGIAVLYFSAISLFQMIKSGDYEDKIRLIASIAGVIFSIFCIFNSKGTLELVIRLLGAILLAGGCICFYQYISKSRQTGESQTQEFKFENNSYDIVTDSEKTTELEDEDEE